MARKFFRRYLPDPAAVRSLRVVGLFGRWLQHPNLWQLNRRSVAGGVAIGLFAGLIPGPLQMLGALLLCVPLRRNIPVALLTTFYSNPFTIVPLYLVAYEYGSLLLGHGAHARIAPFDMDWSNWIGSLHALAGWTLALGKPLALGLAALALTLAAVGYVAVDFGWRTYVVLAWRSRARKRNRPPP